MASGPIMFTSDGKVSRYEGLEPALAHLPQRPLPGAACQVAAKLWEGQSEGCVEVCMQPTTPERGRPWTELRVILQRRKLAAPLTLDSNFP